MAEEQAASIQLLRMFAPLDGMKRENLAALAKKVSVRTLSRGRVLFSQGDTDKRTVWLVSGAVEVDDGQKKVTVLRGGTPEAKTRDTVRFQSQETRRPTPNPKTVFENQPRR